VTGSSLTKQIDYSFSKNTLLHAFSKNETIPLKAVEDYEVGKHRGSNVFQTICSQIAVRLSALHAGRALLQKEFSGTDLYWWPSKTQGYSMSGRIW
jgi:hypothetical protein